MTYKRSNDKENQRYARTIDQFYGLHNNYGRTDQPASFGYGYDFHFAYKKPELRPGCRKNQLIGYDNTITGLQFMNIGGIRMLGVVQGGMLSVYPVSDILQGIRKYYTWQEMYDEFTWDTVDDKTWDDLYKGDNNP